MSEHIAKSRIEFISSFMEFPNWLCEEDWIVWRPLIALACSIVSDENLRKNGQEVLHFFNFHFYGKAKIDC
jgi:hypothetical protein